MVFADHLLLLLAAWACSDLLLVRLMIHKSSWTAARNAGMLALKTFCLGFAGSWPWFLSAGRKLQAPPLSVGSSRRQARRRHGLRRAATGRNRCDEQSAAWPFHRWLISSLNSPTPVSALMHAGLVNGGGFLLVRFAPLYARQPVLLHGLFMVGLVTAVVGTFWKLLQTDIKRMLACSTMGQMGFMLYAMRSGPVRARPSRISAGTACSKRTSS